jgi:PAS domain S-box-containing protein
MLQLKSMFWIYFLHPLTKSLKINALKLFSVIGLLFMLSLSYANNDSTSIIDALVLKLPDVSDEKEKADLLFEISQEYYKSNAVRATEYAELALEISEKENYYLGMLSSYEMLGDLAVIYEVNFLKARTLYTKAEAIAIYLKDELRQLKIELKSILVNYNLGDDNSLEPKLERKLDALLDSASSDDLSEVYAFMANVYFEVGMLTKGEEYIIHILKNVRDKGRENIPIIELISGGRYYLFSERYNRAKLYLHSAIDKAEAEKNDLLRLAAYFHMTKLNMEVKNYALAVTYGEKGVELAEKGGFNIALLENYQILIVAYDSLNKFANELATTRSYYHLRDSIKQAQLNAQTRAFEHEYKNILNEKEIDQTKNELRTKELEIANDALLIRLGIVALAATVLILILLYARLRYKNAINKKLEEQKIELEKLSIVAANIEQMVLIADADNTISWVNKSFEKKYGYLKFECIQKKVDDIVYGSDSNEETIREIEEHLFDKKLSYDGVITHYRKDGTPFIAQVHYTPIRNDHGVITRYVLISQDITEKRKTQEEIRELSLVANNTTNSIVIFDNKFQVLWSNESFEIISGLGFSAAKGKKITEIFGAHRKDSLQKQQLRTLLSKKEAFKIEIQHTNRLTNKQYWLSLNVNPVFDTHGKMEKVIAVATDITAIKELEQQYTSLVEESSDLIYETNKVGEFVFVNDVFCEKTGFSKQEIAGRSYHVILPESYIKSVSLFYEKQFARKESPTYLEFPVISHSGDLMWVGQVAHLIMDQANRPQGFRVIARDISEKREAEEALRKTYKNARLLGEIGMEITSTRTIQEISTRLYDNINQLMDAKVFGIGLPNKEGTELFFSNAIEKGGRIDDFSFSLKDNNRLASICYNNEQELVIGDLTQEYEEYIDNVFSDYPIPNNDASSIIYMPLKIQDKTIGVMTVQSFEPNAFDEYQVSLVRSLATFVAIAIENVTLYETMDEQIQVRTHEVRVQKEELEINYYNTRLLSEIGQLIASTIKIEEIFVQIYSKVAKLMPNDYLSIGIWNKARQYFELNSVADGEVLGTSELVYNSNVNLGSWAVSNAREIRINDFKKEYKYYIDISEQPKTIMYHSQLYYPLIVEQNILGFISIQSKEKNAYQPYHADIIKTLASYIGTMTSNAELYRTLELKVAERTEELARKNKDITSSIVYAKRLQRGVLPSVSFMSQLLPESFVYFQPKDIVSGDFYWIDRSQSRILLAVVDCTGHGVPGAMMSIIGKNLLDQAVNEKGLVLPSQILKFLQVGLSVAFGQNADDRSELFDGMDLSICSINMQKNEIEFAGANNSLYLVRNGELEVIKGDNVGISVEYGLFSDFANSVIALQKGDMIYLTSDGYPDQFGGPNFKKFSSRRMRELMVKIANQPIDEQEETIRSQHLNWKKENDQTDDICFMGVRL